MRESIAPRPPAGRPLRLLATVVLTVLTIALLAALPTARASAGSASISAPSPAEVESLLGGTPLEKLTPAQVAEALSQLPALQGLEPGPLKEALTKTIEELVGKGATLEELLKGGEGAAILQEKLQQALGLASSQLEALLGGNPQQKLEEALESAGVSEVIGKLLGGSAEPRVLIEQILGALSQERLQSLLGSLLAGEPFSKTTVEELARQLGTTVQALAQDLGRKPEELPATAMALTAPLANGERLGVLNGVGGVTLGVIKEAGETLGGTGGTIAGSSTPGTTTVTVQHSDASPALATGRTGVAGVKAGKLKVISHRVKGSRATVVVLVPTAGRLSAGARRLRSISRETAQAERVTLHPSLSRATASSLRRHHKRMRVSLRVSFKAVGGAASSATVPLVFR
jgi:hypothetical protein